MRSRARRIRRCRGPCKPQQRCHARVPHLLNERRKSEGTAASSRCQTKDPPSIPRNPCEHNDLEATLPSVPNLQCEHAAKAQPKEAEEATLNSPSHLPRSIANHSAQHAAPTRVQNSNHPLQTVVPERSYQRHPGKTQDTPSCGSDSTQHEAQGHTHPDITYKTRRAPGCARQSSARPEKRKPSTLQLSITTTRGNTTLLNHRW